MARDVYWRYSIFVTPEFPLSRDELVKSLNDSGFGAMALFSPMHQHPVYAAHADEKYPVSERLSRTGLDLPSSPLLSEDEIRRVAEKIRDLSET